MKELFRETNLTKMGMCRSLLESNGIAVVIQNENEYNALGISQLSSPRLDPVLCVLDDEDYERARAILQEHYSGEEERSREEIVCPGCGEVNPGNFEICWSCGEATVAAEGP